MQINRHRKYNVCILLLTGFVMLIENLNKNQIKSISENMSQSLLKHPLFMFFCRDIKKRKDFINDYFRYYLPEWVKDEVLFANDDCSVLLTGLNPKNFEFKYKGFNSYKMKKYEFASNVFVHRENLEMICDILLPYTKPVLVLILYSSYEMPLEEVRKLVREVREYADKNDITLMYDTFSRRYISTMLKEGFTVAYSKQFITTQYSETVMTYNV